MIELQVDEGRLERLASEIKAMPEEVQKAFDITLRETANTLRTQGVRRMREILGGRPTAREIRGRWFVRVRRQDGGRVIWIGANPFNAARFLTPSQARSQGLRRRYVQVAAHTRAGSSVRSFKRRYQAGVTVQGETYGRGYFAKLRGDLLAWERDGNRPELLQVGVEDAVRRAADQVFDNIPERFYQRFEHQLGRQVELR